MNKAQVIELFETIQTILIHAKQAVELNDTQTAQRDLQLLTDEMYSVLYDLKHGKYKDQS